jgi:hypothetical protein
MLHTLIVAAVLNGTIMFRPQSGAEIAPGGVPVGGALVELSNERTTVATATSATDGTFSIPDLVAGTYSIRIFSNHVETHGKLVVHDNDAPRTFYLFDRPCGALFGRVRNTVTGVAVPHAEVYFIGSSFTDANGDYFISFSCWDPGWSYKFSGTGSVSVTGRRYKKIWYFMREEAVTTGMEGAVLDFELQPLGNPPDHDRLRPR